MAAESMVKEDSMHGRHAEPRTAGAPNPRLGSLALILAICFGVAAIGGIVTSTTVNTWYPNLQKPPITPPDWLFAPVWSLLYLLMGIAAWLVWRRHVVQTTRALVLFGTQLLLNLGWSILFFGFKLIGTAFAEILLLGLAVIATTRAFWRIDKFTGALLLPYVVWIGYATLLNGWIWVLN
jgi:tryptophan-rich sensory protein